jgi:Na+-transporting methylmalonyl-CoA/oxaloacetate decarboxylase gamma subunit
VGTVSTGLVIITLGLACIIAVLIFLIFKINHVGEVKQRTEGGGEDPYSAAAQKAVTTIFNDEFREELRNRGRLHFEKIIGDNAMFLQQDLQLTTSELNEYLKQEITANYKKNLPSTSSQLWMLKT